MSRNADHVALIARLRLRPVPALRLQPPSDGFGLFSIQLTTWVFRWLVPVLISNNSRITFSNSCRMRDFFSACFALVSTR
jgi:hypothetical protein